MGKFRDLTGQRFGRLEAIRLDGHDKRGLSKWLCKCDCGTEKTIVMSHLVRGLTSSCGCYNKEKTTKDNLTHNMSNTRIYRTWAGMKKRCLNPNETYYSYYGGRGITICDKWLKFEGFYEDMGSTYDDSLTLDRINSNGNYEKSNCVWSTKLVQANNKRNNRILTYNGVTDTISNLCRDNNINKYLVKDRLKLGWSVEKAFNTPIMNTGRRIKIKES